MNQVDVFFVSWHDDILALGYADMGMLMEILYRRLWTPPAPLTFVGHEVRGDFPHHNGAVVMLPARHHTSREDVDRLHAELDKMDWCLLFLCGDEEWTFPWAEFPETPTRKVWIMQPRPEHAHLSGLFPGGWYPGTREGISRQPRTHDIFFAGQVRDNSERFLAARAIEKLSRRWDVLLYQTNGYMQGWPREKYLEELSRAKVVPSPSGPFTVDTARPLEAMEAGCVPVCGMKTPRREDYDYWSLIFGEGHPVPTITDWSKLRERVPDLVHNFRYHSNRVFSFWQGMKRKWSLQLDDDVKELMASPDDEPIRRMDVEADDLITVIVTSSPAPIHPSTDHISTVISSVRSRLPRAEILIGLDGVRPEDEPLRDQYAEYVYNLLWDANFHQHNVLPVVFDEFLHQANMTKRLLEMVRTPYVLFLEHDTPLEGPQLPWLSMCDALSYNDAYSIRLHFDVAIHPEHEPLHFGPVENICGVPLRRIRVWWARPFLTRTDHFRNLLDKHFDDNSRTFIEDKLYGVLHCDWEDHHELGWADWRIWTYMPEGDIKRSGHLDSRGDRQKWDMVF